MTVPHATDAQGRPWKRAGLWLCILGPVFFATYGLANHLAAQREAVPSIVFGWETAIPFMDWTIVPYWSIDFLYVVSVFICATRREVDTHAWRLLTAQLVATAVFIAFPLAFSFERPETQGLTGLLFTLLEGFDKPYNQAPSLHIALLVIIWHRFARHIGQRWYWLLNLWCGLIAVSVLTTYQHHFVDVPTGALLGLFCLWLWPDETRSPMVGWTLATDPRRQKLAAIYIASALVIALGAWVFGGIALWLFWPAVSLTIVGLAYGGAGEGVFQKSPSGGMSLASRCLLAPYLVGAWINSRLFTFSRPAPVHIGDGVWISRFPSKLDLISQPYDAVVDLTAEIPRPSRKPDWFSFPSLDLVAVQPGQLRAAARAIETARAGGSVLVCCALGYSRSVSAVAAWMVATGRAPTARAAIAAVRRAGRKTVIKPWHLSAIDLAAKGT